MSAIRHDTVTIPGRDPFENIFTGKEEPGLVLSSKADILVELIDGLESLGRTTRVAHKEAASPLKATKTFLKAAGKATVWHARIALAEKEFADLLKPDYPEFFSHPLGDETAVLTRPAEYYARSMVGYFINDPDGHQVRAGHLI